MKPEIDMDALMNEVEKAVKIYHLNRENYKDLNELVQHYLNKDNYNITVSRLTTLHVKNIEELLK